MKYSCSSSKVGTSGLPPHGGSGLKYLLRGLSVRLLLSPSAWREWIEINVIHFEPAERDGLPPHGGSGLKSCKIITFYAYTTMSPSAWREWIEILSKITFIACVTSPSAWREWIEIAKRFMTLSPLLSLPPHGGSGLKLIYQTLKRIYLKVSPSAWREWIEIHLFASCFLLPLSPSAWREWIEINIPNFEKDIFKVSLRMEGVD